MSEVLDAVDAKILDLIQHDAGLSVAEIAERVGLSSSPCWRRIKRLEDNIEKLKDAGDLVFIWLLYNRSHIGGLDVDYALREWKQSKKEAKL